MNPLTSYIDYRSFIKDWIKERIKKGKPASNRWFASQMEINSSAWLTMLLQGKRNLSKNQTKKLCAVLKLQAEEKRYFCTLVLFNQAKNGFERNANYENLMKIKLRSKKISRRQFSYFEKWYYPVVRSLLGMGQFNGDYNKLARKISPPISAAQAQKAVSILERLNFIKKQKDGGYSLADTAITTGEYGGSMVVSNFQQAMMMLAQESIDRYGKSERDISTVTIGISKQKFNQVKSILAEARKKIIQLANNDDEAESVFQVNMQFFPLSKPPKTKGDMK